MRCDLLFETAEGGPGADYLPEEAEDAPSAHIPAAMRRDAVDVLPEISEREVVRHFNRMAARNFGLDSGPYLLGGRTMRHIPRVGDKIARWEAFQAIHPLQDPASLSAARHIYGELVAWLKALVGMDALTLEAAGDGQAELLALGLIASHVAEEGSGRRTLLVLDDSYFSADGLAEGLGFVVERVPLGPDYRPALPELAGRRDIAALILSTPNCFGRWQEHFDALAAAVHEAGGLVVNQARNIAGFLTYWNPGEAGVDVIIFPLNGVFGVPHYGGGPAVTAVGARKPLGGLWPEGDGGLEWDALRCFGPHWPIVLRAYVFLRLLGWEGLRRATEDAVIAANYLQERMRVNMAICGEGRCLNQFAATIPEFLRETGIRSLDIARRLLDAGIHPPGVGELPVLNDCLSVEPTEAATYRVLNEIAELVGQTTIEVARNFSLVRGAPHTTPIAQPRVADAVEEMITVYVPGVLHTEDTGCGCPICAR